MNKYWLSWNDPEEDYRPLTYPPNDQIIGWWCSGSAGDDSYSTLCALVIAVSESEAWDAVIKDWPTMGAKGFCQRVPRDFRPTDRFPLDDWMQERLDKLTTNPDKEQE